ncbi:hypothetical protein [Nostoc sp.]|uniref:hypothetical protein n=1 Tax=Nostoc sp. TaxID=1180 RepID=UPI002FF739B2
MRSPFTATQPSSRYRIYKLSLVSMSGRSQLIIKSSQKLSRLSMSDRPSTNCDRLLLFCLRSDI